MLEINREEAKNLLECLKDMLSEGLYVDQATKDRDIKLQEKLENYLG